MPEEPRWLTLREVEALHEEAIARFGGTPGLRDEGLLEAALERPRNLHAYQGETSLARVAAAYGFGLARNRPFVDGNKRVTVLLVAVFLALNGERLDPDQVDEVRTIVALAAGELAEEEFAVWIESNASAE